VPSPLSLKVIGLFPPREYRSATKATINLAYHFMIVRNHVCIRAHARAATDGSGSDDVAAEFDINVVLQQQFYECVIPVINTNFETKQPAV
jgi:hypothetical protein